MSGHLAVVAALWVALAVGVGIDAASRGRSGFLWGVTTFFTGLIGLLVYGFVLLSGNGVDDATTVRVCPECSATHAGTPEYCRDCGEPLGDDTETGTAHVIRSGSHAYCSHCKTQVTLDADTCPNCGRAF